MLFKHLLFCSMCRLQRMFWLLRECTSCRFKSFSSGSSASLVAARGGNDFPANRLAGNEPGKVNIYVNISHFTACQLASRSSQSCFAIVQKRSILFIYTFSLQLTPIPSSCVSQHWFTPCLHVYLERFSVDCRMLFTLVLRIHWRVRGLFLPTTVSNPLLVLFCVRLLSLYNRSFLRDMFLSGFLGGVR